MNRRRTIDAPQTSDRAPSASTWIRDAWQRLSSGQWPRPERNPIIAFLWVCAGWFSLVLAAVGVVLPLVPATPFLLLASYCFYRGSPRIHAWLHRSRQFGPMLQDWEHYRGIRRGLKFRAVALVVAVVLASMLFSQLPWYGRYAVLALVAVGLSVIWMVPTLPDGLPPAPPPGQSGAAPEPRRAAR
ncbi:MAG: DUF454 domain-containing protein [Planctomycetia bacterium]|nr:DUF454 domain-containing protein [Planctomycetia bacterium]